MAPIVDQKMSEREGGNEPIHLFAEVGAKPVKERELIIRKGEYR